MSTDLHARVDNAIARVTASRAAAEVLAEIATTHVLVPREMAERAVDAFGELSLEADAMERNKTAAEWMALGNELFAIMEEQS